MGQMVLSAPTPLRKRLGSIGRRGLQNWLRGWGEGESRLQNPFGFKSNLSIYVRPAKIMCVRRKSSKWLTEDGYLRTSPGRSLGAWATLGVTARVVNGSTILSIILHFMAL